VFPSDHGHESGWPWVPASPTREGERFLQFLASKTRSQPARAAAMMFAREKTFLFDHLPKTGGTALRTVFEEMFGPENVSPHIEGRSEIWAIQKYSRFRMISGHFLSLLPGDDRSDGRIRLTMLRHPIDRAVSEYFYWRHHSCEGVDDKLAKWAQEYDICNFFRMRENSNETSVTNFYTKHFSTRISRQMPDAATIISLARESLSKYGFIGICEHMHDSVDIFCWQFKFAPVRKIPRVNVTSFRVDVGSLDSKTLSQLNEMNDLDLQLYDFALQMFEEKKRRMLHELLRKNGIRERRRPAKKDTLPALSGTRMRDAKLALRNPVRLASRAVAGLTRALRRSPDPLPIDRNADLSTGGQPDSGSGQSGGFAVRRKFESFGERTIEIGDVRIVGAQSGMSSVAPGELTLLSIRIVAHIDEPNLTVGMEISDSYGEVVFGTNTYLHNRILPVIADREYELKFSFLANLNRGRYSIGAMLHTGADHIARCFHWCDNVTEFDVVQLGEPNFIGYCRLEPKIEWSDAPFTSSSCKALLAG
jgi:Wzt C-terminal domain/Sulfotransferase family